LDGVIGAGVETPVDEAVVVDGTEVKPLEEAASVVVPWSWEDMVVRGFWKLRWDAQRVRSCSETGSTDCTSTHYAPVYVGRVSTSCLCDVDVIIDVIAIPSSMTRAPPFHK
jgi:hypothetical protein